jgi:3-deoxy-manno-octulosonate cytidylyltransferase (CMP-KDO synthetase)
MSFTVVIPARYASTRLPGKPLEDICGMSMIQRVWSRASEAAASRVLVATDDPRIADHCAGFGAEVVMTAAEHTSGTDRLAEVVRKLGLTDDEIVVNVQGDEPLIPSAVIEQVAQNLVRYDQANMATLCEAITEPQAFRNPNVVKVVFDRDGYALYFSRAPIPWPRDAPGEDATSIVAGQCWRHLGIYAYRAGFLARFTQWSPSPLESVEALEQLRAMHHGERIHVAEACARVPGGVDTAEDLEYLRTLLADKSVG